jgi:hypothetical protein
MINTRDLTPQITGGKKQSDAALIAIRVNLLCYVVYISAKEERITYAHGKFLYFTPLSSYVTD